MARYLQTRQPDRQIIYVFANTGKERPETLDFIHQCDQAWDLGVIWVEALFREKGKGTGHKKVCFETASRNGEPFAAMIEKYGLPNKSFPHCTRELKQRPIKSYVRSLGYEKEDVEMAIGIRADETNRLGSGSSEWPHCIYPLAEEIQVDAMFIRRWWTKQPFDLKLKDYEGNCDLCWKKSRRKRLTLISENPGMETQWEEWENSSRFVFDRDGFSIADLREMTGTSFQKVIDQYEQSAMQQSLFDYELDREMTCMCGSF